MSEAYKVQHQKRGKKTKNAYIKLLPPELKSYFKYLDQDASYSIDTQRVYAMALKDYLVYLAAQDAKYEGMSLRDLPIQIFLDKTEADIRNYISHMETAGASPSAISTHLQGVRAYYKYLERTHGSGSNPVSTSLRPKVHRRESYALSPAQVHRLLKGILDNDFYLTEVEELGMRVITITPEVRMRRERLVSRNYAIVATILGTGMKESEIIGLDMEDVHLEDMYFDVYREKKERIYFTEDVRDALADYISGGAVPSDLFEGHENVEELEAFAKTNMCSVNIRAMAKTRFQTEDEHLLDDIERRARCYRFAGRPGLIRSSHVTALFVSMRGSRMQRRTMDDMIKEMAATYLSGSIDASRFSSQTLRNTYWSDVVRSSGNAAFASAQMGRKTFAVDDLIRAGANHDPVEVATK